MGVGQRVNRPARELRLLCEDSTCEGEDPMRPLLDACEGDALDLVVLIEERQIEVENRGQAEEELIDEELPGEQDQIPDASYRANSDGEAAQDDEDADDYDSD